MKRPRVLRRRYKHALVRAGWWCGTAAVIPAVVFMWVRPHPSGGELRARSAASTLAQPATMPASAGNEVKIPTRATPELMAALQERLQAEVTEAPARMAAVYVQDIGSGLTAAANPNRQFLAASLIKLPVMATTYERWQKQPARKTPAALRWMEWMMTVSDNASTDRLIDLVNGPENVTRFCEVRGWSSLKVRHAILQHRGRRGLNQCTAREIGEFLAKLDRRELVDAEADEEMWQVMCRSKKLLRIPAGVPRGPGIQVGNKTGTLGNVLHDAAIVRTPNTHYAICILLSGQRGEGSGNAFCRELSRIVFDSLNGPVEAPPSIARSG